MAEVIDRTGELEGGVLLTTRKLYAVLAYIPNELPKWNVSTLEGFVAEDESDDPVIVEGKCGAG